MSELEISDQELSRLTEEAMALAGNYWASTANRSAYPATGGKEPRNSFHGLGLKKGLVDESWMVGKDRPRQQPFD